MTRARFDKPNLPGRHVTEGPPRDPRRGCSPAMGLSGPKNHPPRAGVAIRWNGAVRCDISLDRQARTVSGRVEKAGATPGEFIAVTGGLTSGHESRAASKDESKDLAKDLAKDLGKDQAGTMTDADRDRRRTNRKGAHKAIHGTRALWKSAQPVDGVRKGDVTHPGAQVESRIFMGL